MYDDKFFGFILEMITEFLWKIGYTTEEDKNKKLKTTTKKSGLSGKRQKKRETAKNQKSEK